MGLINNNYTMSPQEYAAFKLAEAQHASGVTVTMGKDYRVRYIRPDGSEVPGLDHFLKLARGEK